MEKKIFKKTGRRKRSIARIKLTSGKGEFTVNKKNIKNYFSSTLISIAKKPIDKIEKNNQYDIKVNVKGGGIKGQAESIQLAISRVLCEIDSKYRKKLKKEGFLKRDSRIVERKKPGKKKARKSFQFSKR